VFGARLLVNSQFSGVLELARFPLQSWKMHGSASHEQTASQTGMPGLLLVFPVGCGQKHH